MNDTDIIKSKIDIVDFLSEYIAVKKAGRNFKALCPFHGEKTPSFYISPDRQTWHCFGACAEGGDIIAFLEKWEGIEFLEALQILAKRAHVTLSGYQPSEGLALKEKLYTIHTLAKEFYHFLLTTHKVGERARDYLEKRSVRKEIIETFSLGYAPNQWDGLCRYLQKKGYSNEDLLTAGLVIRSDRGRFYDRFRGRLMFALRDTRGNIVGFSGRVLPPAPEKEAKYINSPETPIYIKGNTLYGLDVTKESIKKEGKAIIVEGEIDMLASYQSGVANVVAIKGSALTEGQVTILRRYTEEVLLGLDSDFAGNEAARRGIEIAERGGLTIKVIQLVTGKDPAECVAAGAHLWKQSVTNAEPVYDFIIESAVKRFDRQDVSGKKKIGAMAVPFFAKITNSIILSHYVKKLAKLLDVSEDSIETMVDQSKKRQILTPIISVKSRVTDREDRVEEHLLSLIIQSDYPTRTLAEVNEIVSADDFIQPAVGKVMKELSNYAKVHDAFDVKAFASLLPTELVPLFDRAFLVDLSTLISDLKRFEKEVTHTAVEIRKNSLRRIVANLSTQLRSEEASGDEKAAEKVNETIRSNLEKIRELEKSLSGKVK